MSTKPLQTLPNKRPLRPPHHATDRAAGFTLVEVLVGMVIGLLCMLVIQQIFAISEGQKRTTTGGADAQTNGAVALYSVEREVRLAGFGTSSDELLKCPFVNVYNKNSGTSSIVNYSPITINPPTTQVAAGQAGTDVIQIVYSSSDGISIAAGATQPSASSANFKVKSRYGFSQGDLAIAYQDFGGGNVQCSMYEITQVAGQCGASTPAGQSDVLVAASGNYKDANKGCTTVSSTRNSPGAFPTPPPPGVAINQITDGAIFNVGPFPVNQAYAVRGNNLTVCDLNSADCSNAANFLTIANDIVGLRAVYGWNAGAGGAFAWTRTKPATLADWRTLSAIRLVMVARNSQKERPNSAGTCDATPIANKNRPDNISWMSQGVAGAELDLSTSDADWQCYRYKLFQTVVPIRNIVWRPGRA